MYTQTGEEKMETAALPTLAIRRVFGLEKKNRKKTLYYIEEELKEIMDAHQLAPSDFCNLALQNYINIHGVPVLMMSIQPEGMSVHHPGSSDIMNLALTQLLEQKGYLRN